MRKFKVRWWMSDEFRTWKAMIDFGHAYRPSWEYKEMMREIIAAHEMLPKVVGL